MAVDPRHIAIIEVNNLHKRYGATIGVDDVSFSVEEGEIFGILGSNGAGLRALAVGFRCSKGALGGLLRRDPGKLGHQCHAGRHGREQASLHR